MAELVSNTDTNSQANVRGYIDYMYCNGLVVGTLNSGNSRCSYQTASHVPFAHNLYEFKQRSFTNVVELCPLFNKLVHNVANDYDYLVDALAVTAKSDDFTKRLLGIMRTVVSNGGEFEQQTIALGILRSDYMVHAAGAGEAQEESLKQVEINTIASSFGVLSTRLTTMQHHFYPALAPRAGDPLDELDSPGAGLAETIPNNDPLSKMTAGIAKAHYTYLQQTGTPATGIGVGGCVVLMIVQPNERNIADQRPLEHLLRSKYSIRLVRATLQEVHEHGCLQEARVTGSGFDGSEGSDGAKAVQELRLWGTAVSVVYFRGGYTPTDYTGEEQWAARLLMERSYAIKCPSISYHLAGCKKIQQTLATAAAGPLDEKNILTSRFGLTSEEIEQLRSVFTGLYSLDPTETGSDALTALKLRVAARPQDFVLKPQREGGGNNIYGADIVTTLDRMGQEELNAHILMDRIVPPMQRCMLVKDNTSMDVHNCICEIGIYGIYLNALSRLYTRGAVSEPSDHSPCGSPTPQRVREARQRPIINTYGGYLLRVKPSDVDEGGVASGFGVLGVIKLAK